MHIDSSHYFHFAEKQFLKYCIILEFGLENEKFCDDQKTTEELEREGAY